LPRPQETNQALFVSHRKNPRAHLLVHKSPSLALSHGGAAQPGKKNKIKEKECFWRVSITRSGNFKFRGIFSKKLHKKLVIFFSKD
jgi:hypothetical protein